MEESHRQFFRPEQSKTLGDLAVLGIAGATIVEVWSKRTRGKSPISASGQVQGRCATPSASRVGLAFEQQDPLTAEFARA